MAVGLASRLIASGIAPSGEVEAALRAQAERGAAFLSALVEGRPALEDAIERELGKIPVPVVVDPVPDPALTERLPPGMCDALLAWPLKWSADGARVICAAADPFDRHVSAELRFQLGVPIELVRSPVRVLIGRAAMSRRSVPRSLTPALGSAPQASPAPEPAALPRLPSDPPIPLVRLSGGDAPDTTVGIAPPAAGAVPPPAVVVGRRSGEYGAARRESEPVIALTRPKMPSSAGVSPPSEPSSSTEAPVDGSGDEPSRSLIALAGADSADAVVSALVRGLERVAPRVVVFATRGSVYHARDASSAVAGRAWVRSLQLSSDRPSVIRTAVEAGQYVGPLPATEIHKELAALLGEDGADVAVQPIMVSGRPALVLVMSHFDSAYLATRRADQLAQAASRALERIVRERKR